MEKKNGCWRFVVRSSPQCWHHTAVTTWPSSATVPLSFSSSRPSAQPSTSWPAGDCGRPWTVSVESWPHPETDVLSPVPSSVSVHNNTSTGTHQRRNNSPHSVMTKKNLKWLTDTESMFLAVNPQSTHRDHFISSNNANISQKLKLSKVLINLRKKHFP